jgi:selenide,water dikinase
MCTLNRAASEAALKFDVHSATDITGFGLLGHAREMATGSKVSLAIDSSQIEFLPEAEKYSRDGFLPGGLKKNRDFIGDCVEFASGVVEEVRNLLFDPQTSGGLLLSVAAQDASRLLEALRALAIPALAIGKVIDKTHPLIEVS